MTLSDIRKEIKLLENLRDGHDCLVFIAQADYDRLFPPPGAGMNMTYVDGAEIIPSTFIPLGSIRTFVRRHPGASFEPKQHKYCECGTDKHGFASHSPWCPKYPVA